MLYRSHVKYTNLQKMASFTFPSEKTFATKVAELNAGDHALNWLDVDKTKIYVIKRIQQRFSQKYGICWLLHLADKQENFIKVWSPRKLIHELKETKKSTQIPFIRSLGQEKIGHKTYNQFHLAYEDAQQPYDIFESIEVGDEEIIDDSKLINA